MKAVGLVSLLLITTTFALAQDDRTAKGCVSNSQNRTIHLCDPSGTTLALHQQVRAYAASTSTIQSFQLWIDGVKKVDLGSSYPADVRTTMLKQLNEYGAGWHRFVFIARDSAGEFRKTAYYYLTSSRACSASSNREIRLCNGLKDGDVVTSPVHIVAATREASGVTYLAVVNEDDTTDFIPANLISTRGESAPPEQIAVSGYVHLKPGVHRLTFWGHNSGDPNDLDWKKVITLTVVE